jgi:hypothetical protein
MAECWQLPEDLIGGTARMRAQSKKGQTFGSAGAYYLPQHEHEDAQDFDRRLSQSFLFPGYEEAIGGLAARPFGKPTSVNEDAPPEITLWAEDVDLSGRDLTQFAHDLLLCGIHRGLAHVLPEFPKTSGAERRTIADDQLTAFGRISY